MLVKSFINIIIYQYKGLYEYMFNRIFIYKFNQFVRQLGYPYFRLVIHSK